MKRSTVEIKYIFSLLDNYLNKNYLELKKKKISVKFIGEKIESFKIKKLINIYNNRNRRDQNYILILLLTIVQKKNYLMR